MIYDLRKKRTRTTINNEDITITANGEYTASEGYTGLGTVTVNVTPPTPLKLNIMPLGCDINEDGIASGFKAYTAGDNFGGFAINTGGLFLENKLVHQNQISFQIAFHTPETKQALQFCGSPNASTGNIWFIGLNADFTAISFNGYNYTNKTASYNFDTDTDYIVRYTQYYSSGWFVKTEVSTDGETFTQIKNESGRLDTDSYGVSSYCNFTQFGYTNISGTMTACPATIDLKKTGFINNTTGFTYFFAE